MTPEVEAFINARDVPYGVAHVEEIAAACADGKIPFCWTCKDWHMEDDEHSSEWE